MPLATPVLFLTFNRPDLTQQVFDRIRQAQPSQLFIAADGPRLDRNGEEELCQQVRDIATAVDWDCQVETLFRAENLGCKRAVSEAITWFFEHVEEGIILEDDCVPHPTFFRFCAELLERYRDDERIMMISGDNFQFGLHSTRHSYYFSRHNHIWGWATWRRAWQYFDVEMNHWPTLRDTPWLLDLWGDPVTAKKWVAVFDKTYAGEIDAWSYQWAFSWWAQHGLAILPKVNLVSNIGFGPDAVHTKKVTNWAKLPVASLQFPLHHPPVMVPDTDADRFTTQQVSVRPKRSLDRWLKSWMSTVVLKPLRRWASELS